MKVTVNIDEELFYSTELYVDGCRQNFAEFQAAEHFNLRLVEKTQWQPKSRRDALYPMIPRDYFKIAARSTEWTVDAAGCEALQLSVSVDGDGYILKPENGLETETLQVHTNEQIVEESSKRAFLQSTVACFVALAAVFLVLPIFIFPPALLLSTFAFAIIALPFCRAWSALKKASVVPDRSSPSGGVMVVSDRKHKMILLIDGKKVLSASEMILPEKFSLTVLEHRDFPDGYPGFEVNMMRENRMAEYMPPYAATASCEVQGNAGALKLDIKKKKGRKTVTIAAQTGNIQVQDCRNALCLTEKAYRYFRKRAIPMMAATTGLYLVFALLLFVFGNFWVGLAASMFGLCICLPLLLTYATYFRVSKQALKESIH